MYSVVLMMALSGGADVPALGHHRDGGCCGYESCGCNGGRHHHRRERGCGCCGNSSGCGCCGYQASCGCCGYQASCGCCGYQQSCGCCGVYGGGYGGGMGGPGMGGNPPPPPPAGGRQPERIRPPAGGNSGGGSEGEAMLSTGSATLVVSVPADAKLAVDGYVTSSTSTVRTLTSPALENGKDYVYTLTAEMARNGKTVTTSKQVTVRAGDQLNVTLDLPAEVVAQK